MVVVYALLENCNNAVGVYRFVFLCFQTAKNSYPVDEVVCQHNHLSTALTM